MRLALRTSSFAVSECRQKVRPFLLMAAQTCGSGPQAEKVALKPLNRIRLKQEPCMEYKEIPGPMEYLE